MRVAFMGSPEFAVPSLHALLAAGHEVVCAYSQPPKPAGRGNALKKTAVHEAAEAHGIPVRVPKTLRSSEARDDFASLGLDCAVVVAYGLILPKAVLEAPRLGCVNVHASLLPRWRGAAPIQRAIQAGDVTSGVTIMQMDEGLDTGPMLLAGAVPIALDTTAQDLHDRLAALGADLAVEALAGLAAGTLAARPQPAEGMTYAAKLSRDEGRIDWTKPAATLAREVRAFTPWPGSWFVLGDERVAVLEAAVSEGRTGEPPGTVRMEGKGILLVACGDGACLELQRVRRAGRGAMSAKDFLNGLRGTTMSRFA